jgi:hypothetical protein
MLIQIKDVIQYKLGKYKNVNDVILELHHYTPTFEKFSRYTY